MTLDVRLAALRLERRGGLRPALVEDIRFSLAAGGTLGIVGESGAGKSLLALAILGLLPPTIRAEGQILLDGDDLLGLSERQWQRVRGARIGMIFQEPMSALNPSMRVGDQIAEGLMRHKAMDRAAARAEALRLMDRVRIPEARRRLDAFPHELSGGQRQRVGIAIAIAPGPSLLVADEPTTALDVTVQAEVLALLRELIAERRMALLLISHDLGVIASMTERMLVMKAGRLVEQGETDVVLDRPAQAYTRSLIAAVPRRREAPASASSPAGVPLLQVRDLRRLYPRHDGHPPIAAVDGVSFELAAGTIFGIVGESGSGKSTLARAVMGLERPAQGQIVFDGQDILALSRRELSRIRPGFQMVFQDPQSSLDPRQTVERIVAEPLSLDREAPRGAARRDRVRETLASVGLQASDADRRPHEFSGGQRQRIAIARAIIGRPRLVVADEPVSALDLSVQAQILRLIADLRDRLGIAFLFISHSLAVIEAVSDQVGVMVEGKMVETGPVGDVFRHPQHPYTRRLIASDLRLDRPRSGARFSGFAPD